MSYKLPLRKVFFLPNIAGGISSVLKQLVSDSDLVVLIQNEKSNVLEVHPSNYFGCETKIFTYKTKENLYYISLRLARLIKSKFEIIVANDWLELEMCARMALKNPVIHIVHGDYSYYYQLAINYQKSINKWLGVSEYITESIKSVIQPRVKDISYMPIGVDVESTTFNVRKERSLLKIIFAGRLTEQKGFFDIFKIDEILKKRNILIEWTIAGENTQVNLSNYPKNFTFVGKVSNLFLMDLFTKNHVLILPSRAEGFPVILIEAMKLGLIPLITNFKSGIPEVVVNSENGFLFDIGDFEGYANAIEKINFDYAFFNLLRKNAVEAVCNKFTSLIQQNVFNFVINELDDNYLGRKSYKNWGSRLDIKWIPDFIVRNARTIINK